MLEQLLSPSPQRPHAPLNIHTVLERVLRLAENEGGWSVRLQRDYDPSLPELSGDADRLTQVVLNLLSNALKYAPRENGQVVLRLDCDGGSVRIEVQDNGPGIPPDQQAMVFEKFRQVAGDQHYRPGGTGLGLPISRQIVEHFGGRLWLESVPGEGATFSFELPLKSAAGEG